MGSKKEFYLIAFILFQALFIPAFAEENLDNLPSVILETDKPEYQTGDVMIISGFVEEKKMPVVALKIFDSNGGILSANQIEIEDDNKFSKTIALDSPFYDEPGTYSIHVDYGKLKAETNFEIISKENDESFFEDDLQFIVPEVLIMFTDKEVYEDGDTVTIVGLVSKKTEESVLVGIYDPFGTPAGFYFGDVDSNLEFTVSFLVKAGVNFKTEGKYTISAFYGDSEETTSFEFIEQAETKNSDIVDEVDDNTQTTDEKEKQQEDAQPKSEEKTVNKVEKQIVNEAKKQVTIPSNTQKNEDKKTNSENNLSVEDIELGIMLNQINLNCDKSEFVDTISYYDSMGPALIRLCKYAEAIYYYDQSLIDDPNNVDVLTNKGSALAKMGFYNEAIVHYDSALAIDPDNFLTLNNKANALANLGNYDDALSLYDKALLAAPGNAVILHNLENAKEKFDLTKSNDAIIEKAPEPIKLEQEKSLISTSTQQTESIFDQLGNIFSSLFNFLS